jgi:heme/copper-type cytochrome/quinol oxidase subunit 2
MMQCAMCGKFEPKNFRYQIECHDDTTKTAGGYEVIYSNRYCSHDHAMKHFAVKTFPLALAGWIASGQPTKTYRLQRVDVEKTADAVPSKNYYPRDNGDDLPHLVNMNEVD